MGTIMNELTEASYLRSLRTTTQEEVDEYAAEHAAQVRYETHGPSAPHVPSAH